MKRYLIKVNPKYAKYLIPKNNTDSFWWSHKFTFLGFKYLSRTYYDIWLTFKIFGKVRLLIIIWFTDKK